MLDGVNGNVFEPLPITATMVKPMSCDTLCRAAWRGGQVALTEPGRANLTAEIRLQSPGC